MQRLDLLAQLLYCYTAVDKISARTDHTVSSLLSARLYRWRGGYLLPLIGVGFESSVCLLLCSCLELQHRRRRKEITVQTQTDRVESSLRSQADQARARTGRGALKL